MITGIVVALPEELSTLTAKKIAKGKCVFIADKLLVAYSGAGPKNAQSAAEHLVAKGVSRLISWGSAAALSSSLKPGDLTLADTLIDADDIEISIASDWYDYGKDFLSQSVTVHTGGLAESKTIISSRKDKEQLRSITGAIALDMESAAIAKVAARHTLPFLAIRVIVDPADMNLPGAISYSLNDQGDVMLGKLLLFLALHPLDLPGLIKLGIYFNAARSTLKQIAGQLDGLINFSPSNKTIL